MLCLRRYVIDPSDQQCAGVWETGAGEKNTSVPSTGLDTVTKEIYKQGWPPLQMPHNII